MFAVFVRVEGADHVHVGHDIAGGKDSLAASEDPAAILAWRVRDGGLAAVGGGPLPWLPVVPSAMRATPDANNYLERLTGRIEELRERVAEEANRGGASVSTPWLRALPPDVDHQLVADLAVFRAAQGVPVTDQRPTGQALDVTAAAQQQSRLAWRIAAKGESVPARDEAQSKSPPANAAERLRQEPRRVTQGRGSASMTSRGPTR